jgi:hypothetical protein
MIVFVQEPGKEHVVMLHSDLDWEPKPVAGPPKLGFEKEDLSPQARRFLGDVPGGRRRDPQSAGSALAEGLPGGR